jgi:DNA-binding NarL/FixJ family response regulator
MSHPIRLLLADDHEALRQGLRALFASEPDVEIVDDVGDVASAVEGVRMLAPDVLVLDLSMPEGGGLAAIAAIRAMQPKTAVLVLTRHRDLAFVRAAFNAGASGYVLKQSPFDELRRAAAYVVSGKRYVDSRLRKALEDSAPAPRHSVSARELEVLRRTVLGQSNKDIASALKIAVKTVEVHKSNGMRKLNLADRAELVRYGVVQGWLLEP